MKLAMLFIVDVDPEKAAEAAEAEVDRYGVVDTADYVKVVLDSNLEYDGVGFVKNYQYLVLEE